MPEQDNNITPDYSFLKQGEPEPPKKNTDKKFIIVLILGAVTLVTVIVLFLFAPENNVDNTEPSSSLDEAVSIDGVDPVIERIVAYIQDEDYESALQLVDFETTLPDVLSERELLELYVSSINLSSCRSASVISGASDRKILECSTSSEESSVKIEYSTNEDRVVIYGIDTSEIVS